MARADEVTSRPKEISNLEYETHTEPCLSIEEGAAVDSKAQNNAAEGSSNSNEDDGRVPTTHSYPLNTPGNSGEQNLPPEATHFSHNGTENIPEQSSETSLSSQLTNEEDSTVGTTEIKLLEHAPTNNSTPPELQNRSSTGFGPVETPPKTHEEEEISEVPQDPERNGEHGVEPQRFNIDGEHGNTTQQQSTTDGAPSVSTSPPQDRSSNATGGSYQCKANVSGATRRKKKRKKKQKKQHASSSLVKRTVTLPPGDNSPTSDAVPEGNILSHEPSTSMQIHLDEGNQQIVVGEQSIESAPMLEYGATYRHYPMSSLQESNVGEVVGLIEELNCAHDNLSTPIPHRNPADDGSDDFHPDESRESGNYIHSAQELQTEPTLTITRQVTKSKCRSRSLIIAHGRKNSI